MSTYFYFTFMFMVMFMMMIRIGEGGEGSGVIGLVSFFFDMVGEERRGEGERRGSGMIGLDWI